jgi:chitosanase
MANTTKTGSGHLHGLTPDQKRRAEQLTSIFENDTTELQYAYVEDLHDGRGITAGRAGFTTRDGDALQVVEIYSKKVPQNNLAKFLPELKRLKTEHSADTSHLRGYADEWKKAAHDPAFRAAQDQVSDHEYYEPSAKYADEVGLKTALARAVLYDSIIQHGDGDDPDGLPALLKRTEKAAGGTPKKGIDEKKWLDVFLKIRREDLENPHAKETQKVWRESVDRVDEFSRIAKSGNYDLLGPIKVDAPQHHAIVA